MLRPPPICTGRGRRLFTRTEWEPPAPRPLLTPRATAPPRWLSASPASRTGLPVATVLDFAMRSLVRLRTSRLLLFEVHMAKCQDQKVARDASSMRHAVRSLTPDGWSKVAKVFNVLWTQFNLSGVYRNQTRRSQRSREIAARSWWLPCPGGQVTCGSRHRRPQQCFFGFCPTVTLSSHATQRSDSRSERNGLGE